MWQHSFAHRFDLFQLSFWSVWDKRGWITRKCWWDFMLVLDNLQSADWIHLTDCGLDQIVNSNFLSNLDAKLINFERGWKRSFLVLKCDFSTFLRCFKISFSSLHNPTYKYSGKLGSQTVSLPDFARQIFALVGDCRCPPLFAYPISPSTYK